MNKYNKKPFSRMIRKAINSLAFVFHFRLLKMFQILSKTMSCILDKMLLDLASSKVLVCNWTSICWQFILQTERRALKSAPKINDQDPCNRQVKTRIWSPGVPLQSTGSPVTPISDESNDWPRKLWWASPRWKLKGLDVKSYTRG